MTDIRNNSFIGNGLYLIGERLVFGPMEAIKALMQQGFSFDDACRNVISMKKESSICQI